MSDQRPEPSIPNLEDLLPTEPCGADDEVADDSDTATTMAGAHTNGTHTAAVASLGEDNAQALSKTALKKLRKRQEWEAGRADRKAKKKELRKIKQATKKEEIARGATALKPGKQRSWRVPTPVPVTLVIDASWDSLMTDAEIISLCGQVSRCYHDVRNAQFRPTMAITSFSGRMKDRFENVMAGQYRRWKGVHVVEESYKTIAPLAATWMGKAIGAPKKTQREATAQDSVTNGQLESAKLVYLSAESPNVLTTLEHNTCYIIGGLVDRNRHKGICYESAQDANIPTARLPIGEYIKLSSRKVLTTNHVVEIMTRYLANNDWAKSFLEVIPTRKGVETMDANGLDDDFDQDAESAESDVEAVPKEPTHSSQAESEG